jgi:hypothetical protein
MHALRIVEPSEQAGHDLEMIMSSTRSIYSTLKHRESLVSLNVSQTSVVMQMSRYSQGSG